MRTSALVALVAVLAATISDALGLLKRSGPSSFERPIYFDLKRRAFLQPRADPKVLSLEVKATVKATSIDPSSSYGLIIAEYRMGYRNQPRSTCSTSGSIAGHWSRRYLGQFGYIC